MRQFWIDCTHKENMTIIVQVQYSQVLFSWPLEIPCPSIGRKLLLVQSKKTERKSRNQSDQYTKRQKYGMNETYYSINNNLAQKFPFQKF